MTIGRRPRPRGPRAPRPCAAAAVPGRPAAARATPVRASLDLRDCVTGTSWGADRGGPATLAPPRLGTEPDVTVRSHRARERDDAHARGSGSRTMTLAVARARTRG